MLLSFPNWIIHISSALEWGIAAALLFHYGRITGRRDIRLFGLAMLPHWSGSLFVLSYHIFGDSIPILLDMSELINVFGSTALLLATMNLLKSIRKVTAEAGYTAAIGAIMIAGKPQSYLGADIFDTILQISSVIYLAFLVLLLVVHRRDKTIFSGLTIAGFWFVLLFISVTIFCMYLATQVRGYPTLSHDNLLHGLAESLLSISNLMIALGAHHKIREYNRTHLPGAAG
ncbi:MAG: DUF2499 domain-containing protein [Chlorobium sp.]